MRALKEKSAHRQCHGQVSSLSSSTYALYCLLLSMPAVYYNVLPLIMLKWDMLLRGAAVVVVMVMPLL